MDEVTAEVVEEEVPEIKWPERVLMYATTAKLQFMAIPIDNIDIEGQYVTELKQTGRSYRILRVQPPNPPKKQRVSIDWGAVCRQLREIDFGSAANAVGQGTVTRIIESHACIVDEEVQP